MSNTLKTVEKYAVPYMGFTELIFTVHIKKGMLLDSFPFHVNVGLNWKSVYEEFASADCCNYSLQCD